MYASLFSALVALRDSSQLYASLFSSLVAGSTHLIHCILTNGSGNSGVNLNGRGPLIDFIHQSTLLHYWLLLTHNALHQPIYFVSVKIMFQSLILVDVGLSILPPLQSHCECYNTS